MTGDSLNAHLLQTLKTLPGARALHLYTLVSEPSRDQDVFLYVATRPKVQVRQILVLLAQNPPNSPEERTFVCAIELFMYTIASTHSTILYVSKVDSTGQGALIRPNPTRALVVGLLQYYTSPSTRATENVWLHVFARAQNQYLFPNSAEFSGKHILRDVNLCKWWKGVVERVAKGADPQTVKLYYLLPGYSSVEAMGMLRQYVTQTPNPYPWSYTHPYHQSHAPLPCGRPVGANAPFSIAHLIPSLPDDPKARFLDEIASNPSESTHSRPSSPIIESRPAKRARTSEPSSSTTPADSSPSIQPTQSPANESGGPRKAESSLSSTNRKGQALSATPGARRALASVSADEFFERMAFRQECSQGAVTGFFTAIFASPSSEHPSPTDTGSKHGSRLKPSSKQAEARENQKEAVEKVPGQQPPVVLDRVTATLLNLDFGSTDAARRATHVLEDSIRGMCGGASSSSEEHIPSDRADDGLRGEGRELSKSVQPGGSHSSKDVLAANVVDPTVDRPAFAAALHSKSDLNSSGGSSDAPTAVIEQNMSQENSKNVGLKSPPTSSTFGFVYGSITLKNPPLPASIPNATSGTNEAISSLGQTVNVLQVRKKKRPAS